jgi:hypothetical protein
MNSAQHEGSRRPWEPMTLNEVGNVASVILTGSGTKGGTQLDTDPGGGMTRK